MSIELELFELAVAGNTVKLSGELTIYSASMLKDRLIGALQDLPEGILDLENVHEIDTAGLQLLMLAKQEAAREQRSLKVTTPSAAVKELVELYRLTDLFS